MNRNKQITYAFIDASNLFYGGEKSLGWKIDYQKLLKYLKEKYEISKAFYFGGVKIHNFKYDYSGRILKKAIVVSIPSCHSRVGGNPVKRKK
ncbi:MAG: hypothetical protein ABH808_02140 [Candidatus Kuenenbacteria bacterium]